MCAVAVVGLGSQSPLGLGGLGAAGSARCLWASPSLSRNDTWNRLRPDVIDHFPNRPGRHDPAVRGHAAGPAVKDRLEHCAVGATVTPTAVDETGPHPSRRPAAVAAVAVHHAEDSGPIRNRRGVGGDRILELRGGRLVPARGDVIGIAHRRRHSTGIGAVTRGEQREQD